MNLYALDCGLKCQTMTHESMEPVASCFMFGLKETLVTVSRWPLKCLSIVGSSWENIAHIVQPCSHNRRVHGQSLPHRVSHGGPRRTKAVPSNRFTRNFPPVTPPNRERKWRECSSSWPSGADDPPRAIKFLSSLSNWYAVNCYCSTMLSLTMDLTFSLNAFHRWQLHFTFYFYSPKLSHLLLLLQLLEIERLYTFRLQQRDYCYIYFNLRRCRMSLLEKARNLAQDYIRSHQPQCAAFWADKAHTLSNGDPNDTFLLAQALFASKQYKRAMHLLSRNEVAGKTELFRYLVAKCHAECGEWSDVLEALEDPSNCSVVETALDSGEQYEGMSQSICLFSTSNLVSATQLLKGKAHEALGNVEDAVDCFKACLASDVFCAEALQRLTHHQYLTHQEEVALLESLPFNDQCTQEEGKMLR